MRYALLFALQSMVLTFAAVSFGGPWWGALWPAAALGWVGVAYGAGSARMLGKRASGRMGGLALVGLWPFFAMTWGTWHAVRLLSRENAWDRVTDTLIIGRRLLPGELPDGVDRVLDLTAEFPEPAEITQRCVWRCVPTLDASLPPEDALIEVLRQSAEGEQVLFIHCAQGHGRTGIAAALWLGMKGRCGSAAEAVGVLEAARPGVRLNRGQRAWLEAVWDRVV